MAKASKLSAPRAAVRTRRAYFDCKFGQLHVRTAFPTTGGFDEQVTPVLFASHRCLEPHLQPISARARRRAFGVCPDLPGYGESDPSPTRSAAEASAAISDLANDLRLRQIDLLGVQYGAGVALELAAARPELVRRLVLVGTPLDRSTAVKQQSLALDVTEYGDHPFDAAPQILAKQISAFLGSRS